MAQNDTLGWILTGQRDAAARPAPPEKSELAASWVRATLGPLFAITFMPFLVVVLWMICARFEGSVSRFASEITLARFWELTPHPSLYAALVIAGWVAVQGLMLLLLPGKPFEGPVTPKGHRPRYKLNGVPAWFVTQALSSPRFSPASVRRQTSTLTSAKSLATLNLSPRWCSARFLYFEGPRTGPPSDLRRQSHRQLSSLTFLRASSCTRRCAA